MGMEVGEEGDYIYLSLQCHHQNDSCIKMGSDGNHFNVSLMVRDKVTRQCPQTTAFEEKGEPKRIRTDVPLFKPNALPLGQTGSVGPNPRLPLYIVTSLQHRRLNRGAEPADRCKMIQDTWSGTGGILSLVLKQKAILITI